MKKYLSFLFSFLLIAAFGTSVGFAHTAEKQKHKCEYKLTKSELKNIDYVILLTLRDGGE